jgi:membrane complex biogenesis BtpA family protein
MRSFSDIFPTPKPLIGVIHLLPLPGAPLYDGNMEQIISTACQEAEILSGAGVDGLIVENFRDKPFFPGRVPAETVAAMSSVIREITRSVKIPVGVNVLRNDAESALAIAVATGAAFIRVNVHMNAVLADQGIIEGNGYRSLRLRAQLRSDVLIFADVGVKHASPLVDRGIVMETQDVTERGLADAIIVSGSRTGEAADPEILALVKQHSHLPVLIGSGTTPETLPGLFPLADGFIAGTWFKTGGKSDSLVDPERSAAFMQHFNRLRSPL